MKKKRGRWRWQEEESKMKWDFSLRREVFIDFRLTKKNKGVKIQLNRKLPFVRKISYTHGKKKACYSNFSSFLYTR